MRLSRLVLVAIGVVSGLVASATLTAVSSLGTPTAVTVTAAVGAFYATAYGLANVTATFIAYRAASRG
jgi:hypothetical protein